MGGRYRNEQKYLLNKAESAILQQRTRGLLEKDRNLGGRESYLIRSIYFDDFDNNCLYEKIDGVDNRKKWRIRSYNCDDSVIHLECKKKVHNLTLKESVSITRRQLEDALSGNVKISDEYPELWNQFALGVLSLGYRPVTIVQYDRIPYIWKPSNVRITFDRNLASGEMFDRFFDENLPVRSIMPLNMDLLEVKFDSMLPDHLRHALNIENMAIVSFSKYELCRKMPINGAIGGLL